MDDHLLKFFEKLEIQGDLEDTAIIFMSDHGLHMQGIFLLFGFEQYIIEKSLPNLVINLPNSAFKNKEKAKKNMETN